MYVYIYIHISWAFWKVLPVSTSSRFNACLEKVSGSSFTAFIRDVRHWGSGLAGVEVHVKLVMEFDCPETPIPFN